MNAFDFVSALSLIKPARQSLVAEGLSTSEANALLRSFTAVKRIGSLPVNVPDKGLRDLFSVYDPSSIEIGMVKFLSEIQFNGIGWVFGRVEADDLLLDANTGRIVVSDIIDNTHFIWDCAKNGQSFLASMVVVAGALEIRSRNQSTFVDSKYQYLIDCMKFAGGGEYGAFYDMLLG